MNKLKTFLLFLPFIGMCAWAMYYANFVKHAVEVVVPVTGYDPRNFLSGHYLEFQIDWANANCEQASWHGSCPKEAFAKVERFYIPENKAHELERLLNNNDIKTEVVFAYQTGARPIAKELLIDGQEWKKYLRKYDSLVPELVNQ